jgi:hypothetical protein
MVVSRACGHWELSAKAGLVTPAEVDLKYATSQKSRWTSNPRHRTMLPWLKVQRSADRVAALEWLRVIIDGPSQSRSSHVVEADSTKTLSTVSGARSRRHKPPNPPTPL